MKKSTIKRALGMVVALAMVPGIYGTALADEATINGGDGAEVNAMFVPDPTVEANVSWGNMNFTFSEKDRAWSVNGLDANQVSVQNLSPHRDIDVSVQYEDFDETQAGATDNIDSTLFMPLLFNHAIESFDARQSPTDGEPVAAKVTLAQRLASNGSADGWLMFTNAGNLYNDGSVGADQLGTTGFSRIGTLRLTISASA